MSIIKNNPNLTKAIVNDLGTSIITGKYDDIDFPTEFELSAKYNASRTIIRESVKMLTAKGILSARPRQGTKIEPEDNWNLFDTDVLQWMLELKFSLDLLIEFNQIRKGIEPQAAALAAKNADERDFARISDAVSRLFAAECGDADKLTADIDFHIAVLNATHNRFYIQLSDMISTTLKYSNKMRSELKGGKLADAMSHKIVFDAIISGDENLAKREMHDMINNNLNIMIYTRDNPN